MALLPIFCSGPGDCRRRAAGIYGGAQRDYYCSVAGAQRSRHPAYYVYLGDRRTTTDLPRGANHCPWYVARQCHCDWLEGVLIARQQGSPLLGAINYVIRRSALPLLGATIIAILAFAPIGLSPGLSRRGRLQIAVPGAADLPDAELVFRSDHHPGCLLSGGCLKTRPVGRRRVRKKTRILTAAAFTVAIAAGAANTAAAKTLTLVADGCAVGPERSGALPCSAEFFPSSSNTPIFFVDLWLPYGTGYEQTPRRR